MALGAPGQLAIALAIWHPEDPTRLLVVQRPLDDEDLPGVWGLPAATLRPGESREQAAKRIGEDKLGCALSLGRALRSGTTRRGDGLLNMTLFEATIEGQPKLMNVDKEAGGTRYISWRWDSPAAVQPAASQGSLCSRLLLESLSAQGARG